MEDGTTTGSVTSSAAAQQAVYISNRDKQIVLWLNNINHAMNHFQNHFVFVMVPTIAREMGFEPLHLSLLTAGRSVFNNWAQLGYGDVTGPVSPRSRSCTCVPRISAVPPAITPRNPKAAQ